MKKAILAIMVLGLCFGLATAAMAAEGTTTVTVTVNSIDELTVPTSVEITLSDFDTDGNYEQVTATDGGQLTYTHNSGTEKKITAKCETTGTGTDIAITVKVADGVAEPGSIVSSGAGTETDVLLWADIAAGSYTKNLTWTADATIANTPASALGYAFTVTFTTTDDV